jgi:mRNA interferase MazF
MERGDIVLVRFPFTDLSASKLRPALVLALDNKYEDIILAFISSVVEDTEETDYILEEDDKDFPETGLKRTSVFKMAKLATLSEDLVSGEIGSISAGLQEKLDEKLKIALNLSD